MAASVDPRRQGSPTSLSPEEVAVLAGGAKHQVVTKPFLYYRLDPAPEPGGKARAAATSSAVVAPDVAGWGGPLTFAVAVDAAGKLEGIRVLESHETPAWVVGFGAKVDGAYRTAMDSGPAVSEGSDT